MQDLFSEVFCFWNKICQRCIGFDKALNMKMSKVLPGYSWLERLILKTWPFRLVIVNSTIPFPKNIEMGLFHSSAEWLWKMAVVLWTSAVNHFNKDFFIYFVFNFPNYHQIVGQRYLFRSFLKMKTSCKDTLYSYITQFILNNVCPPSCRHSVL